jgi:hypothetical protein
LQDRSEEHLFCEIYNEIAIFSVTLRLCPKLLSIWLWRRDREFVIPCLFCSGGGTGSL